MGLLQVLKTQVRRTVVLMATAIILRRALQILPPEAAVEHIGVAIAFTSKAHMSTADIPDLQLDLPRGRRTLREEEHTTVDRHQT